MFFPQSSFRQILGVFALALVFSAWTDRSFSQTPESESTLPRFSPEQEGLSEDLKAAYLSHKDGRFQEAFASAAKAAETGNPDAQFFLAWLHETGRGTKPDGPAAVEAYAKAQEAGHPTAAYRRCRLLFTGNPEQRKLAEEILTGIAETDPGEAGLMLGEAHALGVMGEKPNYDAAVEWWTKAAEAGKPSAYLKLARLREGAFGFPEKADPAAALAYLKEAADLDNAVAMAALGSRFLNGTEDVRNEEEGINWLERAAEKEVAEADLVLGQFQSNQKKNFAKAREHYLKAADRGNMTAQVELGVLHQNGLGGEQSTEAALELFKKAAARGSAEGAHYVGKLLLTSKDEEKTAENVTNGYRFLVAAAGERSQAQVDLALLYISGRLGVADPVSAAAWFDKAARLGNPVAQNNLGALYESGTGVDRNLKSALNLYRLALRGGNAPAATAIGRFYATGSVVARDLPQAWAYFSLAAEAGDEDSQRLLGQLTTEMRSEEIEKGKSLLEELKNPKAPESAPAEESGTETAAEEKPAE